MQSSNAPSQKIAQTEPDSCKTPLRTYSRRRVHSTNPLSLHDATEKRIFRRIKSLHDATGVHGQIEPPEPASVSPRRTQAWMVLIHSGRRDSDSEYEEVITPQSPSVSNQNREVSPNEAAEAACEQPEMITDDHESSDDFSDTEGDLTTLLDPAIRYHQPNTPASARTKGNPVIKGRYLIFNKSPLAGYKVLKKPAEAVAQAPKKATSRAGDGFSSDEARPSGMAWSGKKRKRVGAIDSMDALELTTSTQKEFEALRRIKPPKTRPLRKPDMTDCFDAVGSPKSSTRPEALMNVRPGDGVVETTPYKAPLSHIFEDVETRCNGKTVEAQPEPNPIEALQVQAPVPRTASEAGSVKKCVLFEKSPTPVQDQVALGAQEEEDAVHTIIIPQSSWISQSQGLNI